MSESDCDLEKKCLKFLKQWIKDHANPKDEIAGTLIATIAQFLMNFENELKLYSDSGFITTMDIISLQIQELTRCIKDLNICKDRLIAKELH